MTTGAYKNPGLFIATALILTALALAGCGSKETKMTPEKLQDFGQRYTEAWCSQDPANVASFFTENGSLKINDAAPSVGREAITAAAAGFMTSLPDLHLTMDGIGFEGDRAIYRWTLKGTNTGPGGTGRKVHVSGYEEWTFGHDGRVARSLGHFDAADYARQLAGE
jgi:nuclear transport factor 2 (NTF2) superfamily protein